jgi:hypothetical protein
MQTIAPIADEALSKHNQPCYVRSTHTYMNGCIFVPSLRCSYCTAIQASRPSSSGLSDLHTSTLPVPLSSTSNSCLHNARAAYSILHLDQRDAALASLFAYSTCPSKIAAGGTRRYMGPVRRRIHEAQPCRRAFCRGAAQTQRKRNRGCVVL